MDHNFNPNNDNKENNNVNPTVENTGNEVNRVNESSMNNLNYTVESTENNVNNSSMNQYSNENRNSSTDNYAGSLYSYSYVNQRKHEQTMGQSQQTTGQTTSQSWQTAGQTAGQTTGQNWQTAGQTMGQNWQTTGQSQQTPPKPPKKKKGFVKTLTKCAAIALVFGLVGGTVFYGTGYVFDKITGGSKQINQMPVAVNNKVTTTTTGTQAVVSDVSEVVSNVMPSIVSITNMSVREYQSWFGQVYSEEIPSAGSGIIVAQTEEELYVVTNNHVVEGASTLTVNFVDDQTVSAEIKGTDSSTDLAVITVKTGDIPVDTLNQIKVATLGQSESLKVGEPAIAIGNALGYGQSVTTGVISALEREVTVSDNNNNAITNSLIQTDAAINPGNSGGALLNINGEVIGINSVKYSDTDVEGMGYAIPISTAEPIINDLIIKEVVDEKDSAYLGVAGVDVTDEVSETYNMPKGVYVAQVTPGSAAEKAGIKQGDIITNFDGREVDSMEALAERMKYYAAGTTVEIIVKTAQEGVYIEKTISVTLGRKS